MKRFKLWRVRPLVHETNLKKAVRAQEAAITSLTRLCHEQNRLLVEIAQYINTETTVTKGYVTPRFAVSMVHTKVIIESTDKKLTDLEYDPDLDQFDEWLLEEEGFR